MQNYYQESKQFWRPPQEGKKPSSLTSPEGLEVKLLQHVLETIVPNYPQKAIQGIDLFCDKNWMMNLGPEKARIVISALKKHKPKNILEIGGYCGYSALVLALHSTATVQTI